VHFVLTIRETETDQPTMRDVLTYRLDMAAVGQPLTHHLAGELKRVT